MALEVPILLIAFRRPDLTARVLEAIRQVRPRQLFVATDGPRAGVAGEADQVRRTRALIASTIDWPCRLERLDQPGNLGCRRGVVAALDWFFEQVSEGIILEDDILPDPSFFPYAAELLARYRHDATVGAICGASVGRPPGDGCSYRFSRFVPVWGWATWRRAWQRNDPDLQCWRRGNRDEALRQLRQWGGTRFARRMAAFLDDVAEGRCDTWDYGWFHSCWRHGLHGCVPAVNLVRNIGFGDPRASHCQRGRSPLPPPRSLPMPLRHPRHSSPDPGSDALLFERLYAPRLPLRAWRRIQPCG
jgi:hypothetical protein